MLCGMSGATVIIHRQRRMVRRFREAGATTPALARPLDQLGIRESWVFRHMARRGVFRVVDANRWHLDEEAYARFERRRLWIAGVFLVVCVVVVMVWRG